MTEQTTNEDLIDAKLDKIDWFDIITLIEDDFVEVEWNMKEGNDLPVGIVHDLDTIRSCLSRVWAWLRDECQKQPKR
jgi:hypothetical protein